MRAKELVPILANEWGVPFETAFAVDRSLAEGGLRAKGKGRALPQMDRREATLFLIGCMASPKSSRADEEVRFWADAVGHLDGYPVWFYDFDTEPVEIESPKIRTTLIDYLLWIMHELELMDSDVPTVDVRLCLHAGRAEIKFGTLNGTGLYTATFFNVEGVSLNNPDGVPSRLKREAAVDGRVLWEIIYRTEDPLAESAE